jgi:hypothetical protein
VKSILIFGGVIAAVAAASLLGLRHDDRLSRDHVKIRTGMSADAASGILGQPSWRGACDGYDHVGGHSPDCRTKLVYRSAFAPLKPVYWVVELDAHDRVISSGLEASP